MQLVVALTLYSTLPADVGVSPILKAKIQVVATKLIAISEVVNLKVDLQNSKVPNQSTEIDNMELRARD